MSFVDSEWWRHHFSGAMAQLWQAIVPPQQAAEDAEFIATHLALAPGARVLDLPCGEGRVALALANRAFQVTGQDISADLLAVARQRSTTLGLSIPWHQADMREPADGPWDAVVCWGDSFGYLDNTGNAAFVQAVHEVLAPNGRFALEVQMLAELLERRFQPQARGQVGGFDVEVHRHWNRIDGRLEVTYRLTREGRLEDYRASYRIHTLAELRALLRSAGFVELAALDGQGRVFDPVTSDRLRLLMARA